MLDPVAGQLLHHFPSGVRHHSVVCSETLDFCFSASSLICVFSCHLAAIANQPDAPPYLLFSVTKTTSTDGAGPSWAAHALPFGSPPRQCRMISTVTRLLVCCFSDLAHRLSLLPSCSIVSRIETKTCSVDCECCCCWSQLDGCRRWDVLDAAG